MTARDQILAKPEAVQTVLLAYMTKASLNDPASDEAVDWERYGRDALIWWEGALTAFGDSVDETRVAEEIVKRLKHRPVWGKILRGEGQ